MYEKPFSRKIYHINIVFFQFFKVSFLNKLWLFSRVIDPAEFENDHEIGLRLIEYCVGHPQKLILAKVSSSFKIWISFRKSENGDSD